MGRGVFVPLLLCCAAVNVVQAFPPPANDFWKIERDYASPSTHQFAGWLASQLHPKEYASLMELPAYPYRLPLQTKRNSEVTNAMIGSEETQKMYRDGRK